MTREAFEHEPKPVSRSTKSRRSRQDSSTIRLDGILSPAASDKLKKLVDEAKKLDPTASRITVVEDAIMRL